MNAGDKQIRFTFAVDQRSLGAAKQAIASLTSEVKKLVETMSRAGSAMSTLGGGRGLLGGFSGKSGGINTSTEATMKGGSILTQGIAGDAKALSSVARASNDALRSMTSGMRSSVTEQRNLLMTLRREIASVEGSLKGMASSSDYSLGGLASMYSGRQQLGGLKSRALGVGANDTAAALQGRLWRPQEISSDADWAAYRPAKASSRSWMSRMGQSWAPVMKEMGLGGVSNLLAGGGGMLAGGAALGLAAYKGYNASAQNYFGLDSANTGQVMTKRMLELQRQAAYGQAFGGTAMAIRGGSISSGWAMSKAMADAGIVAPVADSQRVSKLQTDSKYWGGGSENGVNKFGDDWKTLTHGGGLGAVLHQSWQRLGNEARYGYNKLTGNKNPTSYDTREEIAYQAQLKNISSGKAEELQRARDLILQGDPRFANMMDSVYGGAQGRVGMGRVGGVGAGTIKRGKWAGYDSFDVQSAKLTAQGWDMGSQQSSYRAVGQAAGWGARTGLGTTALSMGAGGFNGVEGLYGLGLQYGGAGGGRGMVNAIQSSVGAGGMDVTAGSNLFGALGQAAGGSGQFGFGMNFASAGQALASVGSTGTPGGDMFNARALQGGLGAWGKVAGGGLDGLQGAMNVSAANTSLGGRGQAIKDRIMRLDPAAQLAIMTGGGVPSYLRDLYGPGTSDAEIVNDVRKYAGAQQGMQLARNFSQLGGSGEAGSAASNMLHDVRSAGGDWKKVLSTRMAQKGHRSLQDEVGTLASLMSLGTGESPQDQYGMLLAQLSGDSSFAPFMKAGGAHAAGMSKRDSASLTANAEMQLGEAKALKDNEGNVIKEIKASPGRVEAFHTAGRAGAAAAAGGDIGALNKALATYTDRIGDYTKALEAAIKVGPKR
jgi:hypothetical protein